MDINKLMFVGAAFFIMVSCDNNEPVSGPFTEKVDEEQLKRVTIVHNIPDWQQVRPLDEM